MSVTGPAGTRKGESRRWTCSYPVSGRLAIPPRCLIPGRAKYNQISRKVAFAVCSGRKANTSRNVYRVRFPASSISYSSAGGIDNLDAFLSGVSRSEASRRTVAVATVVGLVNATPFATLPLLPAASEPLACRLSTQDLVELLKMPTCFGEARKVVLKHLGNRYGRTFANHWEFVRFAKEQHLDLDLISLPKRWRRP
jgi:hypothetical protein